MRVMEIGAVCQTPAPRPRPRRTAPDGDDVAGIRCNLGIIRARKPRSPPGSAHVRRGWPRVGPSLGPPWALVRPVSGAGTPPGSPRAAAPLPGPDFRKAPPACRAEGRACDVTCARRAAGGDLGHAHASGTLESARPDFRNPGAFRRPRFRSFNQIKALSSPPGLARRLQIVTQTRRKALRRAQIGRPQTRHPSRSQYRGRQS